MALDFKLDYDRGVPVYRQIYEAVLAALATGELEQSEQLPTIKDLSTRLDINPNTAARAYRDLERDGYLVAKRGRGTFPAPARKTSARETKKVLRDICKRALAEAGKHNLGAQDLIDCLEGEDA